MLSEPKVLVQLLTRTALNSADSVAGKNRHDEKLILEKLLFNSLLQLLFIGTKYNKHKVVIIHST